MGHNNTHSKKLRSLKDNKGMTIVVAYGRDRGREVEFSPRNSCDRLPWIVKARSADAFDSDDYRYNGRDCCPSSDLEREHA